MFRIVSKYTRLENKQQKETTTICVKYRSLDFPPLLIYILIGLTEIITPWRCPKFRKKEFISIFKIFYLWLQITVVTIYIFWKSSKMCFYRGKTFKWWSDAILKWSSYHSVQLFVSILILALHFGKSHLFEFLGHCLKIK